MKSTAALAYLFLAFAGAGAQTPAAPTAPKDKMVCRRDMATGSIMPGRICKLRSAWIAADREADRKMEGRRTSNTMDRSQGGAGGGRDSFGQ